MKAAGLVLVVGLGLLLTRSAWAQPFVLTRTLPASGYPEPADADYNGDGVKELMAFRAVPREQRLVDGRTGAVLRTWTGARTITPRVSLIEDLGEDGRPEFVFGVPSDGIFAISSQSPGGEVTTIPHLWQISALGPDGGFGDRHAVTRGSQARVVVSARYSGRILIAAPQSGSVVARISRDPGSLDQAGFGGLLADAGDLNGDGVNDFAVGAAGRYPATGAPAEGRIYFIDGHTTTALNADVAVTDLPPGRLLGVVRSPSHTGLGIEEGPWNGVASLGDPHPGNGIHETLVFAGTPYTERYSHGGAMAFLATHVPGQPVSFQTVAHWIDDGSTSQTYGSSVQAIGDVTGDGVWDAAINGSGDGSHVLNGRIDILDGAALLDGFQPADIVQTIYGNANETVSHSLRFLGDYDGNGSADLAVSYSGDHSEIRIYSVVPEPTSVSLTVIAIFMGLAARRGRVE